MRMDKIKIAIADDHTMVRQTIAHSLSHDRKLQIVLGHMGEGIPYWLYRIDYWNGKHQGRTAPQLELKASEYFKRNFTITISGVLISGGCRTVAILPVNP